MANDLRCIVHCDHRHPRFIATVAGRGRRFLPTFSNTGWAGGPRYQGGPQ